MTYVSGLFTRKNGVSRNRTPTYTRTIPSGPYRRRGPCRRTGEGEVSSQVAGPDVKEVIPTIDQIVSYRSQNTGVRTFDGPSTTETGPEDLYPTDHSSAGTRAPWTTVRRHQVQRKETQTTRPRKTYIATESSSHNQNK